MITAQARWRKKGRSSHRKKVIASNGAPDGEQGLEAGGKEEEEEEEDNPEWRAWSSIANVVGIQWQFVLASSVVNLKLPSCYVVPSGAGIGANRTCVEKIK